MGGCDKAPALVCGVVYYSNPAAKTACVASMTRICSGINTVYTYGIKAFPTAPAYLCSMVSFGLYCPRAREYWYVPQETKHAGVEWPSFRCLAPTEHPTMYL